MASRATATLALAFLCHLFAPVQSDCECGYWTTVDGSRDRVLFTDLLEADFGNIMDVASAGDWMRVAFDVTSQRARGKYGQSYDVDNVNVGSRRNGKPDDDRVLRLVVNSALRGEHVVGAEIDSTRLDLYHGTYRASLRPSQVPGTCSAFFWYFNDTQEIDMEFLSREFEPSKNIFPVNLVLQSRASAAAGYDAQIAGSFVKANLPFDPTTDFHEYRIDYLPDEVVFYADGQALAHLKKESGAVPTVAGHLILQHWSNGNPMWSGGPPSEDAVMEVQHVKAYFNSSLSQRQNDWTRRCAGFQIDRATCQIPEVTPGNKSAVGWFFSQERNMTNNQTVNGTAVGDGSTGAGTRAAMAVAYSIICLGSWMMLEWIGMIW